MIPWRKIEGNNKPDNMCNVRKCANICKIKVFQLEICERSKVDNLKVEKMDQHLLFYINTFLEWISLKKNFSEFKLGGKMRFYFWLSYTIYHCVQWVVVLLPTVNQWTDSEIQLLSSKIQATLMEYWTIR